MSTHIRLGWIPGLGAINTAQFNPANRFQTSTGYVDSAGFPPTQPVVTSGGGSSVTTSKFSTVNLFNNQNFTNQAGQSSGPTPIVDYGCSDGSRVPDPSMCPAPTPVFDPGVTAGNGGGYMNPISTSGDSNGGYQPQPLPPVMPPTPLPAVVVGLSPAGKFMIAGLGILAGIVGAAVVIHHHNSAGS